MELSSWSNSPSLFFIHGDQVTEDSHDRRVSEFRSQIGEKVTGEESIYSHATHPHCTVKELEDKDNQSTSRSWNVVFSNKKKLSQGPCVWILNLFGSLWMI